MTAYQAPTDPSSAGVPARAGEKANAITSAVPTATARAAPIERAGDAPAALAAGGSEADDAEDYGFMYSRSFFDLDGHGWQVMWMDPAAAQQGPGEFAASMQDANAPA